MGVGHKTGQVPAADVALNQQPPTDGVAANFSGSILNRDGRQLRQGNLPAAGVGDFELAEAFDVLPPAARQPHLQGKPALAFENLADNMAADHPGGVEHVAGVDAIAGNRVAADDHPHVGQPSDLLGLHVGGAGHRGQGPNDLVAFGLKHIEIVTEQAQADVGPHPGNQFLHPQFDRLGEAVGVARHAGLEGGMHLFDQFGLVIVRHLVAVGGLQPHEDVSLVDTHRVVGNLGPAGFGNHAFDLGKCQQRPLHRLGHFDRGLQ